MTTSASSGTWPRSPSGSWPRRPASTNPYLSQIERGLRKPSAEILQQIAKALRISAEQLYVRAGILDERVGDDTVTGAVLADAGLSERQKQVLLEIYESFRRENVGPGRRQRRRARAGRRRHGAAAGAPRVLTARPDPIEHHPPEE